MDVLSLAIEDAIAAGKNLPKKLGVCYFTVICAFPFRNLPYNFESPMD